MEQAQVALMNYCHEQNTYSEFSRMEIITITEVIFLQMLFIQLNVIMIAEDMAMDIGRIIAN